METSSKQAGEIPTMPGFNAMFLSSGGCLDYFLRQCEFCLQWSLPFPGEYYMGFMTTQFCSWSPRLLYDNKLGKNHLVELLNHLVELLK